MNDAPVLNTTGNASLTAINGEASGNGSSLVPANSSSAAPLELFAAADPGA